MRARRRVVCENRVTDPLFIFRLAHLSIVWSANTTKFVMERNSSNSPQFLILGQYLLQNFCD